MKNKKDRRGRQKGRLRRFFCFVFYLTTLSTNRSVRVWLAGR